MILYKKILLLLLLAFVSNIVVAQNDNDEIYSNFERNYNELLQSYYIKQNAKNRNQKFFTPTYNSHTAKETSDGEFQQRLKQIPSCVPLVYNNIVRNHIIYYVDRIGERVGIMLGISKYYFPIFENILDAYGVPSDLKYLVVIESAFNPRAVSRAGATGLWQFMYATGRTYDLRVNSVVDDRRDVVKSTIAAAKYLNDLYSIYRDWSLVLAAYNCGPGNVNKAIKRSGKKSFWEIYDYLPKETRNYVPAFIAATYVMNHADKHGIRPIELTRPLDLINDTINVSKDIYFGQIEKVMGISVEQIRDMNPQYKMDYIPGSLGEYYLRLPLKDIETFIELEDSISNTDKEKYNPNNLLSNDGISSVTYSNDSTQIVYVTKTIMHKVQKRDSWSSIARRYAVTVSDLRKWNKRVKTNKLRKGTLLSVKQKVAVEKKKYIPPTESENRSIVEESITAADNANNQQEQTVVVSTQMDNCSSQQTTKPNKTIKQNKRSTQKTNSKEKKNKEQFHTVKGGETISKIASKYNTSESQILKANGLNQKTAKKIRPGQKLKIK
ncbi:MAG: transglycosylase SLT domain-containing protein [Bacteroidales bacterium]